MENNNWSALILEKISIWMQNPVFLMIAIYLVILLLIIAFLYILRAILQTQSHESKAFHRTIILIRVPKERKQEGQQSTNTEENINQIREHVAVAETLFSSIAGLKREKGFIKWLRGRNDHISFEIVVKDNKISFYVAIPQKWKDFVGQQIHAQYPHAEITEETDYNIFKPQSHIVGAYLFLKNRSAFPLKTYKKMEIQP